LGEELGQQLCGELEAEREKMLAFSLLSFFLLNVEVVRVKLSLITDKLASVL